METFPHHGRVLGPRRVQLHLEILPKHVDSIEGPDDRERELGKRLGDIIYGSCLVPSSLGLKYPGPLTITPFSAPPPARPLQGTKIMDPLSPSTLHA